MKASPPPLSPPLKALCRVAGALLVVGALVLLVFTGQALWQYFRAPAGSPAGSAQVLSDQSWRLAAEVLALLVGVWLLQRAGGFKTSSAESAAETASTTSAPGSKPAPRRGASRWHSCNVLHLGSDARELWQFLVAGEGVKPAHHETKLPNEPLSPKLILKDWQCLFQPRLNVAWLPAEKVFLRVVQLPAADLAEAQSMIDLQLEKLSPIPVAQIVWSFELLRADGDPLRTAIVVIAERTYVEQFLGKLEEQSYLADRLEVPALDQLLATPIKDDGVWVYPGLGPDQRHALLAWWYGGGLHNLTLLQVPPEPESSRYLREQLRQIAWAGEVEGWATAPPRRHLVAGPELAATWEPWLREEGDPVERVAPLARAELAARTARRAAGSEPRASLLPADFAARYRQVFIDRLWMRGLGAVALIVLFGTLLYLGALQVLKFQVGRIEREYVSKGAAYTNAIKIKAEVQVLQEQVDLQYAALECWRAVATLLPAELQLEGINFQRGKALTVFGSGPADATQHALDYNEKLRNFTFKDQPFFSKVNTPDIRNVPGQGLRWNLSAELRRNETD